eukprot:scaffold189765_cov36-Tisochrysis_lutea.AAC.2
MRHLAKGSILAHTTESEDRGSHDSPARGDRTSAHSMQGHAEVEETISLDAGGARFRVDLLPAPVRVSSSDSSTRGGWSEKSDSMSHAQMARYSAGPRRPAEAMRGEPERPSVVEDPNERVIGVRALLAGRADAGAIDPGCNFDDKMGGVAWETSIPRAEREE